MRFLSFIKKIYKELDNFQQNHRWLFIVFLILAYSLLAIFFLRKIVFSPGIIVNGDWSFPYSLSQMERYAESGFYTWSDRKLFGAEQFFLTALPFHFLIAFLVKLGVAGEIYTRVWLVLSFVFPGLAMYGLARFLGCGKWLAGFGGFLYFTLPLFFNYAAMGWLFVLYALTILPLLIICFIKSVREGKIVYSVIAGLLYGLTMETQSLVWYSWVLLALALFLVNNRKSLFLYGRSLAIVFLIFLGMTAFVSLPIFWGNQNVALTKLGLAGPSLGTWARLNVLNIIRVWGSLFNYSYEASYPKALTPFSFFLPALAYSSLLFLRKKRIIYPFVLLSFAPLILFEMGPDLIAKIPFADIIRNTARILALSSFCYVVLVVLVLNFLFARRSILIKALAFVFCIFLAVNAFPFFKAELAGEPRMGLDTRLRNYQFPDDYFQIEDFLNKEKDDFRVLFMPSVGALRIAGDQRFDGAFEAMRDVFSAFSPKTSDAGLSERKDSASGEFLRKLEGIQESRQFDGLPGILSLMGVKYVAVRKNAMFNDFFNIVVPVSGEEIAALLKDTKGLVLLQDLDSIALFENKQFFPRVYIPEDLIYLTSQDLTDISKKLLTNDIDASFRLLSYLGNQVPSVIYPEGDKGERVKDFLKQAGVFYKFKIRETPLKLANSSLEEGLWAEKPVDCFASMPGEPELDMRLSRDASDGKYSLELGSKNHYGCTWQDYYLKLKAGGMYKYSFDYKNVKGDALDHTVQMFADLTNYFYGDDIKISDHNWHTYEKIVEPSEDIKKESFIFYSPLEGSGEIINRFDNIKLWELKLETEQYSVQGAKKDVPALEYRKINPTKYRVVVHNAKESFPLVFSEAFHPGWKIYLTGGVNNEIKAKREDSLGSAAQAAQNIDLLRGHFWETLFLKPLTEDKHIAANIYVYANSWWIDLNEVCKVEGDKVKSFCIKNPDGSYDFEMIIEFWPQRIFYLGLFLAGLTLLICLGYLGYNLCIGKNRKTRSKKTNGQKI